MKVWLNNLKPGDTFFNVTGSGVGHFEIIGPVNDTNYRMSRVKVQLVGTDLSLNEFVNQYVYTEEDEAVKELLEVLDKRINKLKVDIDMKKELKKYLETEKKKYERTYKDICKNKTEVL